MKVLVGCGPDIAPWKSRGWTCNDLAEVAAVYEGIELVGPCWSLPLPDSSVDEILGMGMLEHLTYKDVYRSFVEWKRVLRPGGFFTVDVPDLEQYLSFYLAARFVPSIGAGPAAIRASLEEPDDEDGCDGLDRWLRRVLWGWQRWPGDEHRSGWTRRLLESYAKKISTQYEIRKHAISFDEDLSGEHMRNIFLRVWV